MAVYGPLANESCASPTAGVESISNASRSSVIAWAAGLPMRGDPARGTLLSDGVTSVDYAGVVGSSIIGVPRCRWTLEERYELERVAFNLRARYVGGGVRSRTLTIDQNEVGGRFHFDVGMEYRAPLPGDLTFFGNLVNALDREPPKAPNAVLYDVIGRSFNVGVQMSF